MTPRFFNFGAGPTPTGTRRPPAARASPFGIVWSLRWHPYLVLSSGASVVRSTPLVCDRFGGCYLYDIKAGKTTWRGDDVRDEDWCDKQGRKSQYISLWCARPTQRPTRRPTSKPTFIWQRPTRRPTPMPTNRPSRRPTPEPTRRPTRQPTLRPTPEPTREIPDEGGTGGRV